jgi:hypothetical protein
MHPDQRYGTEDPDQYLNVTDPEHWLLTHLYYIFIFIGRVHILHVHIWICGTAHLHSHLLHPSHCAAQERAEIHSIQISMKSIDLDVKGIVSRDE